LPQYIHLLNAYAHTPTHTHPQQHTHMHAHTNMQKHCSPLDACTPKVVEYLRELLKDDTTHVLLVVRQVRCPLPSPTFPSPLLPRPLFCSLVPLAPHSAYGRDTLLSRRLTKTKCTTARLSLPDHLMLF
jgi:hypothetical protein